MWSGIAGMVSCFDIKKRKNETDSRGQEVRGIKIYIAKSERDSFEFSVNGEYCIFAISASNNEEIAKTVVSQALQTLNDKKKAKALFDGCSLDSIYKQILFDIKQKIFLQTRKNEQQGIESTLLLLLVNTKSKKYFIINIGDGVAMKKEQVISYPEQKNAYQTYSVYQENLLKNKHFRVVSGEMVDDDELTLASSSVITPCSTTKQFIRQNLKVLSDAKLVLNIN